MAQSRTFTSSRPTTGRPRSSGATSRSWSTFWAPWCGPCRALGPIVDKLADQFAGKVKVGKLNMDENGDLAAQYGINSFPRILVFKGSAQPVQSITGLRGEAELAQMLTSVVG